MGRTAPRDTVAQLKRENRMPQTPHVEKHFTGSENIRDIVIGMSDGLTVPFALAAGLSGIANSTAIVITGGLAEIAAGSIAMGLGGYLAAKSDAEHYASERETERREVDTIPAKERQEVEQLLLTYGLEKKAKCVGGKCPEPAPGGMD